jgi:hypothetical protein
VSIYPHPTLQNRIFAARRSLAIIEFQPGRQNTCICEGEDLEFWIWVVFFRPYPKFGYRENEMRKVSSYDFGRMNQEVAARYNLFKWLFTYH